MVDGTINLFAGSSTGPDFSSLIDLIMSWVNPILSLIFIVVGIVATVALIINGVKIFKEKDPNARQEHIRALGYWFLGLVIVGIAALVVNVVFPVIFENISLNLGTN